MKKHVFDVEIYYTLGKNGVANYKDNKTVIAADDIEAREKAVAALKKEATPKSVVVVYCEITHVREIDL